MAHLYIDLETLPASDPAIIAEITAGITPPKTMTKPETIAAWEAETRPLIVADAVAKTSFNGALGSICVVGWAWDDEAAHSEDLSRFSERELLERFATFTGQYEANYTYGPKTVVGHNVTFDLRFLWQRAIVLGVRMPHWIPRSPAPWAREIFDTMTAFAGQRDTISLDNLCKALGIEGKGDFDGSMVAAAWAAGEYDKVASYCRADVDRVRQIHRKMQLAFGETV
jgi:hypothetical protein